MSTIGVKFVCVKLSGVPMYIMALAEITGQ
jgi:hypothetical protein